MSTHPQIPSLIKMLRDAGFVDINVDVKEESAEYISEWMPVSWPSTIVANHYPQPNYLTTSNYCAGKWRRRVCRFCQYHGAQEWHSSTATSAPQAQLRTMWDEKKGMINRFCTGNRNILQIAKMCHFHYKNNNARDDGSHLKPLRTSVMNWKCCFVWRPSFWKCRSL